MLFSPFNEQNLKRSIGNEVCDAFVNKQEKGFRGAGLALRSIGFKRLMSDWFLLLVFCFCFLFVCSSFFLSCILSLVRKAVSGLDLFLSDASITMNYTPL